MFVFIKNPHMSKIQTIAWDRNPERQGLWSDLSKTRQACNCMRWNNMTSLTKILDFAFKKKIIWNISCTLNTLSYLGKFNQLYLYWHALWPIRAKILRFWLQNCQIFSGFCASVRNRRRFMRQWKMDNFLCVNEELSSKTWSLRSTRV